MKINKEIINALQEYLLKNSWKKTVENENEMD